jgi:hypothetical protein
VEYNNLPAAGAWNEMRLPVIARFHEKIKCMIIRNFQPIASSNKCAAVD